MGTIKQFEDLDIWNESKGLSVLVYKNFRALSDYGFRDQICRAAVSVMNNIAEGFERNLDKEFQRFLKIAKGSSGEVRSMLRLALELEYINKNVCDELITRYTSLSSRIAGFIKYLNQS
ncbi:four helix bundle protein [Marinifilum sp. D714]|uniref:four helix bundle protein n=1 Tax=Marinifilum sp. D714 TaxID=2937523 RepID=UPI0027D0E3EA|nr:four helix bundle protein [Marinifilum sp. D714]MDQ2178537.1 four helix bundle protein [Marinifilum sp. D714]